MPETYQRTFDDSELRTRRQQVSDVVGSESLVVLQGAADQPGAELFRQTNEFYYLTGLETSHTYLLVDGGTGTSTLYLMHRDSERERSAGTVLSAEDAQILSQMTGVEAVKGIEHLSNDLSHFALRGEKRLLYTPFQPEESPAASRDELLEAHANSISDPWDGTVSRSSEFVATLRHRYPQFQTRNLSPALDALRIRKSPREVEVLKRAGWLTAHGISEAMRATAPGVMEYQLAAVAGMVFRAGGARGGGYQAIVAGGQNSWFGHYSKQASTAADGDLILMDWAPDFAYYTSDIGRMWPVSGKFTRPQRTVYEFILEYHRTVLDLIQPGATADEIMDRAQIHMREVLDHTQFETPARERAARWALSFRGHMSHPVGMSVHDVGRYRDVPLEPGTVFCVDPMMWIDDERQYVRVEDTVVVTDSGVDVLTKDAPLDVDSIEALMADQPRGDTLNPVLQSWML